MVPAHGAAAVDRALRRGGHRLPGTPRPPTKWPWNRFGKIRTWLNGLAGQSSPPAGFPAVMSIWWMTGAMRIWDFKITGPKGSADVRTQSRRLSGQWTMTMLEVVFSDGKRLMLETNGGDEAAEIRCRGRCGTQVQSVPRRRDTQAGCAGKSRQGDPRQRDPEPITARQSDPWQRNFTSNRPGRMPMHRRVARSSWRFPNRNPTALPASARGLPGRSRPSRRRPRITLTGVPAARFSRLQQRCAKSMRYIVGAHADDRRQEMDLLLGMFLLEPLHQVQFRADRPLGACRGASTSRMILPVEPLMSAF